MPFWSSALDPRADENRAGRRSRDNIRTVTSADFDTAVLEANEPIAVEFMSYGCVHCRAIEPVLQQVAEMVSPSESIVRVNMAVEPDLAARFGVEGTPTLIMFSHGREVGRSVGPQPDQDSVYDAVTRPFA
jgi:thioredoxin 1